MADIYLARSTESLRKFHKTADGNPKLIFPGHETSLAYERHYVFSLTDIYELLTRLTDDPYRAIVMGRPINEIGERKACYFEDLETDFWFIDLDGVPQEGTVEETIERCLPFLFGKQYVYAFTSSAGFKPDLRVRVICLLPKPMSGPHLQALARHYNDALCCFEGNTAQYIDSGIYAPSSLLLTARPDLKGQLDPYPERVHFVLGDASPVIVEDLSGLVPVNRKEAKVSFDEVPQLDATRWGRGDGNDRSEDALKGIGRLRGYMGEKRWRDLVERRQLWHDMIRNAGGVDEDFRSYGDFATRRGNDARVPSNEKAVLAHPNQGHAIPLEIAEKKLGDILRSAAQMTDAAPKVIAVNVTMGTGKTFQMLRQFAVQHRYYEDVAELRFLSADFYVPTIALAEEASETAVGESLDNFVEYGRGQKFLNEPVCHKADVADQLNGLVQNVAEHICKNDDEQCPHLSSCRWQWQRTETKALPLRIRTHHHLTLPLVTERHPHFRYVNFVVIDEASFVNALIRHDNIEIGDLIAPRVSGEHYEWALRFARVAPEGLSLDALRDAGLTPDVFSDLAKAEEALAPSIEVTPRMSEKESLQRLKTYDGSWRRYANAWAQLKAFMETGSTNRVRVIDGKTLSLAWKEPPRAIPWDDDNDRPAVPVILLSGTMRRGIIEQVLPVDEWHDIEVTPHPETEILQCPIKGTMTQLLYGTSAERMESGETDVKKVVKAQKLLATIDALLKTDDALVLLTFKELREQIGHNDAGHYFALEGLDRFKGRNLLVVGRPLPSPRVPEQIARALYCDDPQPIRHIKQPWYSKRGVMYRGVNDCGLAEYHPDPRVEDIRWSLCEGEMMQAIARSRYVRQAVKVIILAGTPLPIPIDRIIPTNRLHPQWRELEGASFRLVSQNEYVRLWPDIFRDGRNACRFIDGEVHNWASSNLALLVEYRTKSARGPGKRAYVAELQAHGGIPGATQLSLTDDPYNEWAIVSRELADLASREPLIGDEGALVVVTDIEEFVLETAGGDAVLSGRDYRAGLSSYQWPWR